jgi:hypothetical protein
MESVGVQRKKRYVVLAMLAAAFLLVALAPYLLSTGPVLRFVVSAVDKRLAGSLSVGSWLVGWQQGILCQQVVYTDDLRGIRLRIPRLTSTQGLLELALAPHNLGLVVADSPQLEIRADVPAAPGGAEKRKGQTAGLPPLWNHLIAELEIRAGQATVFLADPELAPGIRNFSLSATVDSGVVTFTLGAHALHDQGSVKATGTLNLPAGREGGLDTLVADARLAVNGLQLRDLLTVAGKNVSFPVGEVVLSADLRFKGVGLKGLEISGHAELDDMSLRGGFLGDDTPSFAKVRLKIDDGKWTAAGWSVGSLELASDAADLSGSGRYGADGLKLAGKGRFNLPVLFTQFPGLCRLREETLVETGTLDGAFDLEISENKRRLDLKARMDAFSGLAGDQEFAWAGPVVILLNGEQAGEDLRVHALKFDSPFFQIDGRGDLHSFVLDASADLTQAFGDIGRLFRLEWDGSGQLDLAVKGRGEGEGNGRLKIETDMQVSDLTLRRADELVVPTDDFSLLSSVSIPLPYSARAAGAVDLQFALSSWLGETFLTMNGEKPEGGPFHASYSTDTSLNLASATGLLHALKLLPGAARVAGDMQIQAVGRVTPHELEVREFTGEVGSLNLVREDVSFVDQQVRMEILQSINEEIKTVTAHNLIVADSREKFFRTGGGSNVVNFAGRSLFLHNLSLTSATGTFTLAELLVPDWRTPFVGLEGDLAGTFDLAQLAGLLRGATVLNEEMDFAGTGQMALQAKADRQGGQEVTAELRLADVSLVRQQEKVPVSRELLLGAHLSRQTLEGDVAIRELRLQSDPLEVAGSGSISGDDARRKVELQGRMTPALERISMVLRDGFGFDLQLAGGQGESFLAQYVLAAGDENSGAMSLVTSLHADRLEYQGITVRSLHIPVSLEKSGLHLEVSGQLGGGKLVVIMETDLAGSPATITIPANSQILTGVQVEKPLLDGMLSSLHPLFGTLTRPSGQIDLRLDSFSWPGEMAQGKAATFAAVTDLRELSLESSEVLREILTPFGLEKEKIELHDSELSCTGQAGRIACSPIRVKLGGADMAISGSSGPDGALDYLLEVPVTRKIVSEEGYQFLQGATVRVALRGTVKSPVFDRAKTLAAVRDLLRQAASKIRQEEEKKPSAAGEDQPDQGQEG